MSAIPSSMRFGPLPEAIKSRQYQSLFRAQNLTYSGTAATGDTIRIDTPSLPGTYLSNLDSFLTVTLTNATVNSLSVAAAVTLEAMGAHALINRIQIFCGGVLIQDLQGYNVLLQYLYDFSLISVTPGEQVSTFNASAGAPSDITATRVPATALAAGASRTVCLPLHCLHQRISAAAFLLGGSTLSSRDRAAPQPHPQSFIECSVV